ncbi:MAG: rod shape-determining protein MreD [Clostridiales bacterium]|nr:rod shape-determining protein MreD [Clostridiales bacterium]
MRIKVTVYTICILLILLIQTTLLDYVKIYGVKPNLLLVFVIMTALLKGYTEGAVIGCLSGFALDMLTGGLLGFYALLFLYLGIAIGFLNRRLYKENYIVMVFFVLSSTVGFELVVYILTSLGSGMDLLLSLTLTILPEALYNCIIAVVFYFIMIRVNWWIEGNDKSSRKY